MFHTRETHKDNFLVVEVKRDGRSAELADDLEKIREYWFPDQLHYQFGAVINLKRDKSCEIEVVSLDSQKPQ